MVRLIDKLFSSKKKELNKKNSVDSFAPYVENLAELEKEKNNEMLVKAYMGLWNALSFRQQSAEALECATDPYEYARKNLQQFEERGIQIESTDVSILRWIGIVDLLIKHEFLFEVDGSCSLDEFVEKVHHRNPDADLTELDPQGDVETWIKILDYRWKREQLGFIQFDIDSDSYVLYVDNLEMLKYFNRKNEYLPQNIKRAVEPDQILVTEPMFVEVCDILNKNELSDYVALQLHDVHPSIFESKLGGLPYLETDQTIPTNKEGKPLCLLAQIVLEELPEISINLPKEGMLQFWIESNDLYGLDFDGDTSGYCVRYIKEIDTTIKPDKVQQRYLSDQFLKEFPFEGEFGITFTSEKQKFPLYLEGTEYDIVEKWNERYPESIINGVDELGDIYDDALDASMGTGHKISGYPFFTQYDPRNTEDNYDVLLLQIDSDRIEGRYIDWGDAGVANFFISKENLDRRDFSDVLYNWDCY